MGGTLELRAHACILSARSARWHLTRLTEGHHVRTRHANALVMVHMVERDRCEANAMQREVVGWVEVDGQTSIIMKRSYPAAFCWNCGPNARTFWYGVGAQRHRIRLPWASRESQTPCCPLGRSRITVVKRWRQDQEITAAAHGCHCMNPVLATK